MRLPYSMNHEVPGLWLLKRMRIMKMAELSWLDKRGQVHLETYRKSEEIQVVFVWKQSPGDGCTWSK